LQLPFYCSFALNISYSIPSADPCIYH